MKKEQFISLLILILAWIGSTHYILSQMPEKIVANMLSIEYDKVWWIDNYMKIKEITKEQTLEWLKQYDSQKWEVNAPVKIENKPVVSWNTISLVQAKKVISEDTYILWNPDAEISFVEYSDLECPYCKKLHVWGTIEKVIKEYDWKVNFIFKQFPLSFHAQAPMEAEAALCAWDLGWSEKYYEFIEKTFSNSKTNGRSYTKESISKLWAAIWLDEVKLLACIKSWKNKSLAQTQMSEGKTLFGVTWTPWNVFINNKTWEWDKLPWAQPFEAFKQKIDSLIN